MAKECDKYVAEFDGLKLRPVTEDDYARLEEWIAADPAHASLLEPDFFLGREVNQAGELAPDPRASCYALEDSEGTVFYIRLSRAARVHIQFAPEAQRKGKALETATALQRGMAFLEVGLSRAGAAEWIFSTESQGLKSVAKRLLGFSESKTEMVRPIVRLAEPEKPLRSVQQQSEKGGE
jgi:hypothetical protein